MPRSRQPRGEAHALLAATGAARQADRAYLSPSITRSRPWLDAGGREEAVANAIIDLARNLGLKVIAEGVETDAQLAFLRSRQCDEAQGYHFSRPVPAEDVERILLVPA